MGKNKPYNKIMSKVYELASNIVQKFQTPNQDK